LEILSEQESERLNSFTSDRRKIEFYFTRLLWKEFGYQEFIKYGPEGNPIVSEGQIGVSHSKHNIVIGHSLDSVVGIDVENYSEKVIRIAQKFMSENEMERFGHSDIKRLTTIWSIKEAVFKMRPKDHLVFRDQIEVLSIDDNCSFRIHYEHESLELPFKIIPLDDCVITFCLADN
jgi:4'-phosphopantetheinyl transferase